MAEQANPVPDVNLPVAVPAPLPATVPIQDEGVRGRGEDEERCLMLPSNRDDHLRRVDIMAQAAADQMWAHLDERLDDVLRIAVSGPWDGDREIVMAAFRLLAYQIAKRRMEGD